MDRKDSEGKFLSYSELLKEGKTLIEQGNREFLDAKTNIEDLAEDKLKQLQNMLDDNLRKS